MRRLPSIQRSLGINLVLALLPTLLLTNGGAYWLAHRAVANAYDSGLLDDARDIAATLQDKSEDLPADINQATRQALLRNDNDRLLYAVWDAAGAIQAGDPALRRAATKSLRPQSTQQFSHARIDDDRFRCVVLRAEQKGRAILIAVATTTHGMQKILNGVLEGLVLLDVLLVLAVFWGLQVGIRRGLRPLGNLCTAIASRSTANMQPVDAAISPAELRPVVASVNSLLRSLGLAIERHRHFIADAAHQLRTPLAVMRSRIDVARLDASPDAALANELLHSIDDLSHLTQQLVSLARLDQLLLQEPQHTPCDLPTTIQRVITRYWPLAQKKAIEMNFALTPASVLGTPLLLEEMLANLFDNAIRYSAANSEIDVSLRIDNNMAIFEIGDRGPGVKPESLAKLGTRFFREHNPRSADQHNLGKTGAGEHSTIEQESGCGLGLAIVREIVELHRGAVTFANRSDAAGFVVTVALPCAPAADSTQG